MGLPLFPLWPLLPYLRGDGGEAAAEVHVLPDLAAVSREQPVPKSAVIPCWPVAVALIGQELRQVPVVRGRGPHQGDEDGLGGHVELKEQTQKPSCVGIVDQQADKPHEICVLLFVFLWATDNGAHQSKGEKREKEASSWSTTDRVISDPPCKALKVFSRGISFCIWGTSNAQETAHWWFNAIGKGGGGGGILLAVIYNANIPATSPQHSTLCSDKPGVSWPWIHNLNYVFCSIVKCLRKQHI